LWWD